MFDYDAYNDKEAEENAAVLTAQQRKWGRRHTMSWDDLSDNVKVFPQHAEQADAEILRHLGYMPPKVSSLRHEPFIRALVEDQQQGKLTQKAFDDAVAVHMRHIRNDDMQRGGWANPYTEADYHRYDTHLVQFKERARARLLEGLSFEPPLDYSLDAELILREQFLFDWFSEAHYVHTPYDCKACTIMFYRKALAEAGRDVANEIDLMGLV
jgi:hypothetical protein